MASITETATITFAPSAVKPNVPLWLTGHQCPRVEYNPTSEYKLKKGDKTGWGVVCQFVTRAQRDMNAIYVGGLDDRRAEGYGEWHSEEEKISYHGGFKDNVASGYGKYCDGWTVDWPDSWVKFLPGDAESEARFTYEGGFRDGYFHGYGELIFRDKSRYEGSWKDGRRHGYGKYIKDNGVLIEFQLEGALKHEERKQEERRHEYHHEDHRKESSPQIIYVQPAQQPQILQPYVVQPQPQPQQQPIVQVSQPQEHNINAGVAFAWGHGNPQQRPTTPQPQTVYYQPVQPVEIPVGRVSTPQPIPVQFTYSSPPRPVTPSPSLTPNHRSSQGYIWTAAPQQATPQSPPYPDVESIQLQGSPQNTQYFPHM
jgi:hypothetical protein